MSLKCPFPSPGFLPSQGNNGRRLRLERPYKLYLGVTYPLHAQWELRQTIVIWNLLPACSLSQLFLGMLVIQG
jgi:hypothetical protein